MIERRTLVKGLGIGIATGLFGAASTYAESAAKPGKQAKPLSGKKLRELIDGNGIDGATHKGHLFTIEFRKDGTATKLVDDGRKAVGVWGIDGDEMWYQLSGIANGEKISLRVWKDSGTPFYKAMSASGKWIAFTVRKSA